ncbi:hypothetical protein [Acidocella sp.]|uniref:hypothetical protein n=1 Tax=Acidocella sp. TaxID=50710 RepID=UPI0026376B7A|nr:hypothetical protein [Acidocella sp.]
MAKSSNLRRISGGKVVLWDDGGVLAGFAPPGGRAEEPRAAGEEEAELAAAPVCEGYVDGLDPRWNVVGWVRMPARPERRLSVGLLAEEVLIATDTALRFRGDLLAARYGDGNYGFHLAIPGRFFDGGRHRLAVRVLGEDSETVLGRLELTLPARPPRRAEPQRETAKAAALVAEVLGARAEITPAELEGFAQDLSEELGSIARHYDAATAIGLLYVHVLRRRADEDGLQTRLTRLSQTPEQMSEVVREVVFSDEAAVSLRQGTGGRLPSLAPLRAWARLRRFA